jgi:hypothetical protein
MSDSSEKCTTQIGWPIRYLYPKIINIRGCVLIILILTVLAKKILSTYPESIKSWIPG